MAKANQAGYKRETKMYTPAKGGTEKKFRDPSAPTRPPSAFFFCSEHHSKSKGEHLYNAIGGVAKKRGEMWNNTAVDERADAEAEALILWPPDAKI